MFSSVLEESAVPIFSVEEKAIWDNKESVMQGRKYRDFG
jgi:hypothetical protein